jgi:hypothetical protein
VLGGSWAFGVLAIPFAVLTYKYLNKAQKVGQLTRPWAVTIIGAFVLIDSSINFFGWGTDLLWSHNTVLRQTLWPGYGKLVDGGYYIDYNGGPLGGLSNPDALVRRPKPDVPDPALPLHDQPRAVHRRDLTRAASAPRPRSEPKLRCGDRAGFFGSHRPRPGYSSGTSRRTSSSQARADMSDGARQSPRGDSDPPAATLGPFGNADRLNWLKL